MVLDLWVSQHSEVGGSCSQVPGVLETYNLVVGAWASSQEARGNHVSQTTTVWHRRRGAKKIEETPTWHAVDSAAGNRVF